MAMISSWVALLAMPGSADTVAVRGHRALEMALQDAAARHGWFLGYEDPPWDCQLDTEDVSEQRPRIVTPRRHAFRADYDPGGGVREATHQIVRAWNARSETQFEVVTSPEGVAVVPVRARDAGCSAGPVAATSTHLSVDGAVIRGRDIAERVVSLAVAAPMGVGTLSLHGLPWHRPSPEDQEPYVDPRVAVEVHTVAEWLARLLGPEEPPRLDGGSFWTIRRDPVTGMAALNVQRPARPSERSQGP